MILVEHLYVWMFYKMVENEKKYITQDGSMIWIRAKSEKTHIQLEWSVKQIIIHSPKNFKGECDLGNIQKHSV